MALHAKTALLGLDWRQNLRLSIEDGRISEIHVGAAAQADDICVDVLLPATGNLHSHSFQRAMAGMTETRVAGRESFWTWRDLMYRFLDRLSPDHIEAIAALTFMEMQEAGYASVGEFHYVHHQQGGASYEDRAELSHRIFAAAGLTGIGLTHLPVLYTYGGVRQEPLAGGQKRFGNSVETFMQLVDECRSHLPHIDSVLGIAPHSLRATSGDDLRHVVDLTPSGPVHIHIAEQVKEVDEVIAALGQRPVSWLLDNVGVDHRWCLIHATHMTDEETRRMAQSGAVAGLCPITEANLGDGIFNGGEYVKSGGAYGVGSDSNIRISLTEELRMFEYSQRLRDRTRAVLISDTGSVGHTLYTTAAHGSAQALGRDAGRIEVGKLGDLVAIDRSCPSLCALRDDQLLDGLCFASSDRIVTDLWSAGRHMVRDGQHVARAQITNAYRAAIADLLALL